MKNNIKLATILSTLVTGSVVVTALTLPDFNSVDSYLFRHANWSKSFYTKEQAIEYMTEQLELDNIFNQDIEGTRTVNEYLVEASLNQMNDYFKLNPINPVSFDDAELNVEEQYEVIVDQFMKSIAENLSKAISTSANLSNVYVPTASLNPGGVFTSQDFTHLTSELYRGSSDSVHSTISEAFASLIDDTQVQFDYNGASYNTIPEVIDAWMTNEGFSGNTAYEEVQKFASWRATATITSSDGNTRTINNTSVNNSFTEDTFKEYTKNAFYQELRLAENGNITSYSPTESEWLTTEDYSNSYTDWGNDNQVIYQSYLNSDLLINNLSVGIGYVNPTDPYRYINDVINEFFPAQYLSADGKLHENIWQIEGEASTDNGLPSLDNKLSSTKDILSLSYLALHTPELNEVSFRNFQAHLTETISGLCMDNGDANTNSSQYKSWIKYAEFMGFDSIDIPEGDRPNNDSFFSNNEKWYEPDCGIRRIFIKEDSINEEIRWFNYWFSSMFDMELDSTNSQIQWYMMDTSAVNSDNMIIPNSSNFKITANSGDPYITGKTLTEALKTIVYGPDSEENYQASETAYKRDYLDWENNQDFSFTWFGNTYADNELKEAMAKLEAGISEYYDDQFDLGTYEMVTTSHYKYSDSHYQLLSSLSPSTIVNDFNNIEYARDLARNIISTYGGSKNAWDEHGVITMLDDEHYKFDTSIIYNSVDEAMNSVNWSNEVDSIRTDSNYNGLFSSAVEYTNRTYSKLDNFNDSGVDILFDMTADKLAIDIVNGLKISSVDPSIQDITIEIKDPTKVNESIYETQKISITFDNVNKNKTYWVITDEYDVNNLADKLAAIDAARQELVKYWENQIK